MKEIEFDVVEIIDDKYGHRLKHSKRVEIYTDEQVRHNDLCTVCGFPSYPECREWCQNEQWAREKAQRNNTEEIKDTTKEVKDKTREVKAGSRYKHFKGFEAVVITVGTHTETGEKMVVYSCEGKGGMAHKTDEENIYIRPLDMFLSEVDHEKYPDVKQKYRFEEMLY